LALSDTSRSRFWQKSAAHSSQDFDDKILRMLNRLQNLRKAYPRQFWLLTAGMLVSTIGSSMVWPFLTIYLSKRLALPLLSVAALFTVNAIADLVFSFIAGPIVDRTGRKRVMVISLVINGLANLAMSQADSLAVFALLMMINGAVNPLYRIGADAMLADLIPAEQRPEGYSLTRTANNLGIALGPAIGGLVAAGSYTASFVLAASGLIFYGALIAIFARETLPGQAGARQKQNRDSGSTPAALPPPAHRERLGGYDTVLKDRNFVSFSIAIAINTICAVMIWQLMGVYANTNYGVPESQYGLIPSTNAAMVVVLQFAVTLVTKRFSPVRMAALGTLIYAVAAGSVSLAENFSGFWLCMVIMTFGELILVPTATTYVANLAPIDMRGRYMSLYGLTWSIARGIGPLYGGFLNDALGPKFIWYGGFAVGLIAVLWLLTLDRRMRRQRASVSEV
jgi:MFS family permease